MLGEKIYEWTAKVQAQRGLPADVEGPRMEITFAGPFQGHGRLSAFKGMGTATYIAVARPDGIFQGAGQGMIMAADGTGLTVDGFGRGRVAGGKFTYRGAVTLRAGSPNLSWINEVVGVFEYEQDINT